ncbi:MAG: biotin/lipoyl-binding protein [Sphaerospermopsis kisseleviana]
MEAAIEGTVKKISVKENQIVKEGAILAILDDSQLQTQKSQLQGNIQKYRTTSSNTTSAGCRISKSDISKSKKSGSAKTGSCNICCC